MGAVKRCLRAAGYGKVKVGHGGTLDPLAEGVLPIALGEATKLAGRMLDADKIYAFTVKFGEQTDTLDTEGTVIATSNGRPTLAQVEAMPEAARDNLLLPIDTLIGHLPRIEVTRAHAERFGWEPTTAGQLDLFRRVLDEVIDQVCALVAALPE